MKRALELDPLSLIINANLGLAYIHVHRFDEAIAQFRKTVEMDGEFYYARYNLALALELKGLIPEATAEYRKTISISDDPVPLGMLGRLYAAHGRRDEAQQILQQLRQRREQRYTPAYPSPSFISAWMIAIKRSTGSSWVTASATALT
jgi:tetratricopeptide (TPR) repeat protein